MPVVVLLPTAPGGPRPAAHEVAPRIQSMAFSRSDHAVAARPSAGPRPRAGLRAVALTAARATAPFSLVGVTWAGADAGIEMEVSVRTRSGGVWTDWHDLDGLDDVEADPGSPDAGGGARAGTAPYWVGPSDGVQVRVDGARTPHGLRVELVDPGRSAADSSAGQLVVPASSAQAEVSQPPIVTRKAWGADESLRSGSPDYTEPIKVAYVHHTDTTNTYTAAESPSIVRSIYAYHTKSRGWSDIGYNFLIDKYGTVFEGRYGGIDKAVLGAHTGGFNSHSFAASLMGNFTSVTPSTAMMSAVSKLIAWKLGRGYLDPGGKAELTSSGGGTSRYSSGTKVSFNVISGHRDAGYTACPGTLAYNKLGSLRSSVKAAMGAAFVAPSVTPASRGLLDPGAFTVGAGAVNPLTWTLTVTSASTGLAVRTLTGSTSGPFTAVWDGLGEGATAVPPGRYLLRLDGTTASTTARPWTGTVEITSPVTLTAPIVAGWGSQTAVKGRAPAGSEVAVEVRRGSSQTWEPVGTTVAAPDGSYTMNVTVDDDLLVRASSEGYPSSEEPIRVAPTVALPARVTYGEQVTVNGTARPGDVVSLRFAATGQTTRYEQVSADDQGRWTSPLTATAEWVVSASARNVWGFPATLAVAPTLEPEAAVIAALRTSIPVRGTAAPGAAVQVQVQPTGAAAWTTAATATAAGDGSWGAAVPLEDDLTIRAFAGGLASAVTRTARVRPTAGAPATAGWQTDVPLRGTARPGSAVAVRLTTGSTTTTRTTTASSAGAWSLPFALTQTTGWLASSGGLDSESGTTTLVPLIAAPKSAVVGRPAVFAGLARPGASVALRALLPGATDFAGAGSAEPDASGRFSVSITPSRVGSLVLRGTADGATSANAEVPVVPADLSLPYRAALGASVPVVGWARPDATVRIEIKPRTQRAWTTLTTTTASGSGRFTGAFRLSDDTAIRASTDDGTSAWRLTKVGPTLSVPASARPGTRIGFTGTARPGIRVTVYVKHSFDTDYVERGYATASSGGSWLFRWYFKRYISVYVSTGSLSSARLAVVPQ